MIRESQDGATRLEILAIDRATVGLDADHHRELERLVAVEGAETVLEMELTATLVDRLYGEGREEPALPPALAEKLRAGARHFASASIPPGRVEEMGGHRPRIAWTLLGYGLAAAATIAWVVSLQTARPGPSKAPPAPPTERVAALETEASDLVRAEWSGVAGNGFEDVTGDAVFSPERQEGYMRFRGLEPNDPSEAQYQLWIVDPERDPDHPVDGGVFDVPAGASGEVVVPIRAALAVRDPKAFVITLEKPGGVVVSAGPFRVMGKVEGG